MANKLTDSVEGLPKFVLGWAIPSATSVGIFALFVLPTFSSAPFGIEVTTVSPGGAVLLTSIYAGTVLTMSTLFAYLHLPIYRLLEGYSLPASLRQRLRRRQMRTWHIIQRTKLSPRGPIIEQQLGIESAMLYPETRDQVQPTRLGNALRAMETYGSARFGLDGQTLWYELLAAAPDGVRRDSEQARASVDFFVSSVAHFFLLGVVSLVVAAFTPSWEAGIVAVASFAVVRPAYSLAVRNMLEWRFTTQALIHLGRVPLAPLLGFELPRTARTEWDLWRRVCSYVHSGRFDDWESTDPFRLESPRDSASNT